ncbi:Pentatricopeptide repeat-containing protein At3g16010 [Olea europaea subsp. europaea]|uniref:Pentatricopeptide repeat-containing protein At3g16010 n=1 Tax=Olea europaea subsp. europaea TaxID=158383 RepID=A0A8S0T331_OLEEU|nr:Pentatricopeptide repeat-containing protein At3g16010 [Olea europaea subsp. europaea]
MNSLTPRLDALPILLIYPQNQKPQAAIHHLQSRARRSRMYGGKNHTEDKEKMVVEDVAAFPNNKKKMFVIRHNLQQHFANSHSDSLSGVHNIIPSSLVNLISRTEWNWRMQSVSQQPDGIGARPSPIRWCCWWFPNLLKTPPATNEKYNNWPQ